MRRVLPFVCIAGSACLVAAVAGCNANIMFAPSPPVPVSTSSSIPGSPIQHIVVIMQ